MTKFFRKTRKNPEKPAKFLIFLYKTKLKPENQGFSQKTKVLLRKPN